MKKLLSLVMVIASFFVISTNAFADQQDVIVKEIPLEITTQMLEEAQKYAEQGKDYEIPIARIEVPEETENGRSARVKTSDITIRLSQNTGGVEGKWEIIMNWRGSLPLYKITADSCQITSPDILNPYTYFDKAVKVYCHLTTSGSSSLGTAFIPNDTDGVRIGLVNALVFLPDDYIGVSISYPPQYYPFN